MCNSRYFAHDIVYTAYYISSDNSRIPVNEVEILSKDVQIDGELYTLSSDIKYGTNCIRENSTSISVDDDGKINTNTSYSQRFESKSSLSIHGIEVPCKLFSDYTNRRSKTVLIMPFPFSVRLDIGQNNDLNLNSARDQIIYDEKWLSFEESFYSVICGQLATALKHSDWERLKQIIKKNNEGIFNSIAQTF